MFALNIGLAIGSMDLLEEVRACVTSLPVRVVLEQRELGEFSGFIDKLQYAQPDALVLGYPLVQDDVNAAVCAIKATVNAPAVILAAPSADPEAILRGMRAGADEFLYPPVAADLTAALDRILNQRSRSRAAARRRGKVLAVLGAKGGCGGTTLACHVAMELSRLTGQEALLADFDVDSGMVGFLMKSQSRYSVMDALAAVHKLDVSLWKALVSNGHHRLDVLMAPTPLGKWEPLDQRAFRDIVPFVRATYDWAVLDLGSGLTRPILSAVGESDETFLIATPDIPALHQTKQMVRRLQDSGLSEQQLHIVLNRTPRRLEVTLEELDKMLGAPVYATVPDEPQALADAYSSGTLLPTGSGLGSHFTRLAARIAGLPEQKPRRSWRLPIG